ncbi:MAG: fructose-6-phosphate aldolase [Candidatus Fonsibacter sp.]|jgi:transaldolase|nr:fructose-6-phosphate aldolase [Candidatus Fonsibacter sp.]
MEIFLDSSDIKEIRGLNKANLVDGITTNPSLLASANTNFKILLKEICSEIKGPVSAEVTAPDVHSMLKEADVLKKIAKNIVIKVPLTWNGLQVCSILSAKKVKVNVTLCFSTSQALLAAKAGATYVSPFIGRLEDIGDNGIQLIADIKKIFNNYKNIKTKILSASIRSVEHFNAVATIGSDVATVPVKIFKELHKHHLTDKGVDIFTADWKKSGMKILT